MGHFIALEVPLYFVAIVFESLAAQVRWVLLRSFAFIFVKVGGMVTFLRLIFHFLCYIPWLRDCMDVRIQTGGDILHKQAGKTP